MNEGERQKFEAWAAVIANDSNTFVRDPEIEWAWQGYKLGRAEQPSQTRAADGGSVQTPIEVPLQSRSKEDLVIIIERLKENLQWYVDERNRLTEEVAAFRAEQKARLAAAVPVEDRPAPTPQEKMAHMHEQRNADLDLMGAPEKE